MTSHSVDVVARAFTVRGTMIGLASVTSSLRIAISSSAVRIAIAAGLFACAGGAGCNSARGKPAGAAGAPATAAATATAATSNASRAIDGTGVCPYTSEAGPAHGRVFRGCNVFAPMDSELPLIACTDAQPCVRPCRRTDMANATTVSYVHEYRYDDASRLVEAIIRDARGNIAETTRYTYESATAWHIDHASLLGSRKTTIKLDDAGRMVERVSRFSDGSTLTFRFTYDETGRLLNETRIREERGSTEEQQVAYAYDDTGRLVARQRSNIRKPEFRYIYGSDGTVATIEYKGGEWHVRRDAAGRAVELLNGNDVFTRFVYDAQGRLIEAQELTDGTARRYSYDC